MERLMAPRLIWGKKLRVAGGAAAERGGGSVLSLKLPDGAELLEAAAEALLFPPAELLPGKTGWLLLLLPSPPGERLLLLLPEPEVLLPPLRKPPVPLPPLLLLLLPTELLFVPELLLVRGKGVPLSVPLQLPLLL